MNRLRLVHMLYSRGMVKELFFGLQIFLMVLLLMTAIVPITNVLVEYQQLKEVYGGEIDQLIYYTEIDTGYKQTENINYKKIFDSWMGVGVIEKIYQNMMFSGEVITDNNNDDDDRKILLLVYSEDLYQDTGFQLSEQLETPVSPEDYPVVISEALAQDYPLGSVIPLSIENGAREENLTEIKGLVVGVLKPDSVISYIGKGGGTYDYIYRFGGKLSQFGRECMVLGMFDEHLFDEKNWNAAAVFSLNEKVNSQELLKQMNEQVGVGGRVSAFRDLYQNTLKKVLRDAELEMLLVVLFLIVFVVDFWGYILMSIRKKGHLYAILFMCGLSKPEALAINLLSIALMVLPAVGLGMYAAPMASELILRESFKGYTWHIYPVICGLFLITMLVGVLSAFVRQKNLSVTKQYREEM